MTNPRMQRCTEVGEERVAPSRCKQRHARRQTIGHGSHRHAQRRGVEEVGEVGEDAETAVELHRIGQHRVHRRIFWHGRQRDDIAECPGSLRRATQFE